MKYFTTILFLVGLFSLIKSRISGSTQASAKLKYYVIDSDIISERDFTFTYNSWEPKSNKLTYLEDAFQMIQPGTFLYEGPAAFYEGILYYVDEGNMIIHRYNPKTNSIIFHIDAFNQSIFVLALSPDQTDFTIMRIPLDRSQQSEVLQTAATPYKETAAGGMATGKDGHYYYATFAVGIYDTIIYKVSLSDPTQIESVPFCPGMNVYYNGFLWDEENNQMSVVAGNSSGEYVTKISMNGGGCHLKEISTPQGLAWWSWTFDAQTRTVHAWTMDEAVNSYIIQYDIDTWKILSRSVRLPAINPMAVVVAHE